MNDLATRLRALADRLDAIDLSQSARPDLDREMVLQRIEDFEWMVTVVFGTGEAMPQGEIRVTGVPV